jgi:beta-glucanase (GH16 family)
MLLTGFTAAPAGAEPASAESAPARWNLVFADQFRGSAINETDWVVFDGPGPRTRQNVIVRHGKLILRTRKIGGQWLGAGVGSNRAIVQTYGKYEARIKSGPGLGIRAVALLWPDSPDWPPEVDFFEIGGDQPKRRVSTITNHYTPGHQMEHLSVPGHYMQWHNVGVEWTPDALKFTLDGRVVRKITEHIPQQPMWFGLQSGIETGQYAPGPRTPRIVDYKAKWVRVWQMA